MDLEFVFYAPEDLKDTEDVKEIEKLIENIKSAYKIGVNKHNIGRTEENQIKSQFLWHLSVVKRIGIKQTIRKKALYPQFIIFNENTPILKNRIKCLHDNKELKEILMGVSK